MKEVKKEKSKDKIILVIYLGIFGMTADKVSEYSKQVSDKLNIFDDSVIKLIIPSRLTSEIKIECINPVLLNEVQYNKVNELINTANNLLNDLKK